MPVNRNNNSISFSGENDTFAINSAIQLIEEAISYRGYQHIELDFSKSESAFAVHMLRLCSFVLLKKKSGIDFSLYLNGNVEIERLFTVNNWASIIDPDRYKKSNYKGFRQVPAVIYSNPEEQQNTLNEILDKLFSSYTEFVRSDFASIEWTLNEIMDNVLVHSNSACGGII
jgi:hypothetical protein